MSERNARVIHTGQAIVDLVMEVDALPAVGGDVFADAWSMHPGGGFNVMAAASRAGAAVVYTGGHGTGTFGDLVRAAMRAEGVDVIAPVATDRDTGFCVALVDAAAERTFVSTLGAEGTADLEVLRSVGATPSDVVYVSGYSLYHEATSAPLVRWMPELQPGTTVVLDVSPMVGEISDEVLSGVTPHVTAWTLNESEARVLLDRLVTDSPDDLSAEDIAARLCDTLAATVLLRAGSQGCWVAAPGDDAVLVPGIEVVAVDTNGAGDAHAGYVCAELSRGVALVEAVRRGNAAAAIAITRRGPATAPTSDEIDR